MRQYFIWNKFYINLFSSLILIALPIIIRADVYCYMGGGSSPNNGTTLGLHTVCVGNYCYLGSYLI